MMKVWHTALRLAKRTFAYSDQAVVSGTNFLVGILLARALGMDAYGTFVLGWMAVLFASSLQQAIILNPLYTLLPKKDENHINTFKGGIVSLQLILTLLTIVIGYTSIPAIRYYLPENVSSEFLFALPLVMGAFVTQDFLRRMLYVEGKAKMALVGDIVAYGLQIPILGGLWYTGNLSLTSALMVIGSCFTASTILNLATLNFEPLNQLKLVTRNSLLETLTECWTFAKYLVATSLLQWFSGNAFIVVAGGIIGPAAVGAVRIAQNVMGVLHVLFLAMENTVPIKAAQILKDQGEEGLMVFMKKTISSAGMVTLFTAGSVAVFSKTILGFLYGTQYMSYHNVLAAFAALYLLIFLGTVLRFTIRTLEKNQYIFITYVFTTIFSVVSAEPIVQAFGTYGIILGLFGVHSITLLVFAITLRSELKLMLWPNSGISIQPSEI